MDIQHIKQIAITDYLQQQGYTPARVHGIYYWYCSPLRNERTPLFKVNTERNQWYDFGTGEHGDIIDLVCMLHHCDMAEALQLLGNGTPLRTSPFSFGGKKDSSEHKLEFLSVELLTSPHLLNYISERRINSAIANEFCYEINYRNSGRLFYAIGFANDAGGWEIRNSYFKGCITPKAITTISRGSNCLQIFEGFMDFLSWQTLNPSSKSDAIVLNSLVLLQRIKEQMMGYQEVESFLDNDDAGRKSFAVLKQICPQIVDGSARYRNYKDLNEWLVSKSQLKEKQPLLPITKRGIRR